MLFTPIARNTHQVVAVRIVLAQIFSDGFSGTFRLALPSKCENAALAREISGG